jgi:lipopolysaccharide transport system ATP-binding protein
MSRPIIEVENLSKRYRLGQFNAQTMREEAEQLFARFRNKGAGRGGNLPGERSEFWALKDVSFSVQPGEVIGIIGRNGAGKSTLLKILCRVTEPTTGQACIRGRVASLLEVGTGFHPELTGRENIYLNGAILGMTRAEIRAKFDEIVAFAEVDRFLDTPVKRYSSGMYVRLAFAVAAHLEPEILIVDEVLAVGDAEFQKKCLGRMGEIAKDGRTVLFVSHNMGAIRTLTQDCIYLENGRVLLIGDTDRIVEQYLAISLGNKNRREGNLDFYRRDRNENSRARILEIKVKGLNEDSHVLPAVDVGSGLEVEIAIQNAKPLHGAHITIIVRSANSDIVSVVHSEDSDFTLFVEPGCHTVTAHIPDLPLAPGQYSVDVGVASASALAFDVIVNYPLFNIVNKGQIVHWLERPWGPVHLRSVNWTTGPYLRLIATSV